MVTLSWRGGGGHAQLLSSFHSASLGSDKGSFGYFNLGKNLVFVRSRTTLPVSPWIVWVCWVSTQITFFWFFSNTVCWVTSPAPTYKQQNLSSVRLRSYLHRLSSLLCICQQLDGDGPAVLNGVLQVNESVAHVTAHAALSADRHRAGFTEEQKHLRKQVAHASFQLCVQTSTSSSKGPKSGCWPQQLQSQRHASEFECVWMLDSYIALT